MIAFRELIELVGMAIDLAGVAAVAIGLLYATYAFAVSRRPQTERIRQLRQNLGSGILIGLELLIAADIVRTVAITPTLESVLVLGLIVIIRTFLSMTLQVELDGRWPWKRSNSEPSDPASG